MLFAKALDALEKSFRERYELGKVIRHRGERGRHREEGLRMFLEDCLPAAYGVATGELLPYSGRQSSPQCDIIIYDRLRFPIIGRSDSIQLVPLDACYAVIECKSVIDSKAISDSRKKFAAIRELPRCPMERKRKPGTQRGPVFVLFGYKKKISTAACKAFVAQRIKEEDTYLVALDDGLILLIEHEGLVHPVYLKVSDPSQNMHQTLAMFFTMLLEILTCIDLGSPRFWTMLNQRDEEA